MLRLRRIQYLLISFMVLTALASPLSSVLPAAEPDLTIVNNLQTHLLTIQDVWLRRITLDYLSNQKSEAFLDELLKDFSTPLRKNFLENIKGETKKEFLANYAAKLSEETKRAVAILTENAVLDGFVLKMIQESAFPADLGFAALSKKVLQRRKYQLAQSRNEKETEAFNKLVSIWQQIVDRMAANAKKDRYEPLDKMYRSLPYTEFPIEWYDNAQYDDTAFETEGDNPTPVTSQGRKPWTVLVYVCADNDLERFGLQDINEMEKVGSSDKVNIVVQVDRLRSGEGATIADGNWTGTRRYYVSRDNNLKKITSKMVGNLGETDMGNKKTLADFLQWGVETYPADNVAVVIWNHGMGWLGVAIDDSNQSYLRLPDISWAFAEGQKALTKVNGKPSKFAIVDFDACLMGTIEVGYELADYAQILVASQETEPGTGMPYADYLEPLVRNPSLSAREFSKRMVGTYVQSYSKDGSYSSSSKYIKGSAVTKSAIDLAQLESLVKLIDKLGTALLKHHDTFTDLLVSDVGYIGSIRRYSESTQADLVDIAVKLSQIPDLPAEIRTICFDIIKLIGYPVDNDRLSQPVIIVSPEPGFLVWGYNNWRMPPKTLWPPRTQIFRSRLAITPLMAMPDNKGYYCAIGPFEPVIDEALEKRVFVDEINYQVITESGKLSDKMKASQGKEFLIVSAFPKTSPLVIEGHTQGMGDSRGICIYYPPAYLFTTRYKGMKFAKDTNWDEFIEKVPEFKRTSDILLTGEMVQDPMTIPEFVKALSLNNVNFQILWDPSIFGYQYKKIFSKFLRDGVVITDSVSASSMGKLSPSSDDLSDYLRQGGSLLIAAQSFEQSNIHRDFLKDYFKFSYVDDERDFEEMTTKTKKPVTLVLNEADSAKTAEKITIMKTTAPGKLFVTLPDNRGAGIAVSDTPDRGKKPYHAIYLGFRYEAVSGEEQRAALMSAILDFLYPKKHQMTLFD